jgi:hypothetical protein
MKMIVVMIVLQCLVLLPIKASGQVDVPSGYVDLGKFILIPSSQYYELFLPYNKPEGVEMVPSKDIKGVVIDSLIADGKQINSKRLYFVSNDASNHILVETALYESEERELKMIWSLFSVNPSEKIIKEGLYYDTLTDKSNHLSRYIIPYGAKEVFLTYRIRFSIYSENYKTINIFDSEPQTARWFIEWP